MWHDAAGITISGDPQTLPDGPGSKVNTGKFDEIAAESHAILWGLVLGCVLTHTIFYSISLQFR